MLIMETMPHNNNNIAFIKMQKSTTINAKITNGATVKQLIICPKNNIYTK